MEKSLAFFKPVAIEPDPTGNCRYDQYDCELVPAEIPEQRFDDIAEKIADSRNHHRPEKGAAQVEEHKPPGRKAARADDDRRDSPHAVDEAVTEDGDYLVADQKTAHPVDTRLPVGSFLEKLLPLPLPHLEHELVGTKGAAESSHHDPWQRKVAAVRQNSGDDHDGLPFKQCAGQEGRISVGYNERFKSHASSYHRNDSREVIGRPRTRRPPENVGKAQSDALSMAHPVWHHLSDSLSS